VPEAREEFVVSAPKSRVVEVLSNPKEVGECFGFVKGTSEDGKIWYVKAPMSAITQTRELHVSFSEEGKLEWEARGEHLLWRGRFEVEEVEGGVKVVAVLYVEGLGAMASIINPMASVQIRGQLRHFVKKLKEKISGV